LPTDRTNLTRKELYERVWSTPMRTLAQEFGISDVGLAKLCRRHEIPLPGRGYWARLQFGQKPERTSLPAIADPRLESITIFRSEPKERSVLTPEEKEQIPVIEVATNGPTTHIFVGRIERNMTKSNLDERGMLLAKSGSVVPVKVSPSALPRAMRLFDALFAATDKAGHKVEWPTPYNTQIKMTVLDEKLTFFISESTNRREHQPTPEERARQKEHSWQRPPQWDIIPNGFLRFTLSSCEYQYTSHSWNDGKRRKLENCVGEIFLACEKTAKAIKQERLDRAEAERRRVEEQKRRAEEAARQAEYDRKAKALMELARSWQESKLIKDFTTALQTTLTQPDVPETVKEELQKIVEWGFHHADYVDPLTDLNWVAEHFKKPSWMFG
jgi:hypothetical protein